MEAYIKQHRRKRVVTLFKRLFVIWFLGVIGVLWVAGDAITVIISEIGKAGVIEAFNMIILFIWFSAWLLWNAFYLVDPERIENVEAWINPSISMFMLTFFFGILFLSSTVRSIMFYNTYMMIFGLCIGVYNLIIFIFAVRREFKKAKVRRFEDL